MVTELDELQSALHCSASASNAAGTVIDLGTAISKVIDRWLVYPCVVWLETAESCHTCCILLYRGRIQSWLFFCFNVNNITDCSCSMWKLKKKLIKQWKALQTASKSSMASSKGSMKFQNQINYTILWKSFPTSWKKWSSSFGDGWQVTCVRVHSSPSKWIRGWLVGSSQVHLCWLSKRESNRVEGQTWRLQRQIWPKSYYRYPSRARSGLRSWYSIWLIRDWYQPPWQKMQRLPLTRNWMI